MKTPAGAHAFFDPAHGSPFFVGRPRLVVPKPQRQWSEDMPGGAFLDGETGEDLTGHFASKAHIQIGPDGKATFLVSADAAPFAATQSRRGASIKVNLFKQRAGWRWLDPPPDQFALARTLISIERGGRHHYALRVEFSGGIVLARYEKAPSEPRLRPTSQGQIQLNNPIGRITIRGQERLVFRDCLIFPI